MSIPRQPESFRVNTSLTMNSLEDDGLGDRKLTGRLRTFHLVVGALAFASPLSAVCGYIALLIAFGNGIGATWSMLTVMVVLLMFALAYGALARHVALPGAFYSYITVGLGRHIGLGSAFIILASYVATAIGVYGFVGYSTVALIDRLNGPSVPWWFCAFIVWCLVSVLAYFRVELSIRVMGYLLALEIVVVILFNIMAFTGGINRDGFSIESLNPIHFFDGNIGFALVFAVVLFTGFESTAVYRDETVDPTRSIPRASLIVVLTIGLFYGLTAWAFVSGLGTSVAVERAAANPGEAFFTVIATQFGGQVLSDIAAPLLITGIFAALLSIHNVTSRYIYSLAVDGVLPRWLGRAHPRSGSPSRAAVTADLTFLMLTSACVFLGLSAIEVYSWLAGIASFTLILVMMLVSLSAVVFYWFGARREDPPTFSTRAAPLIAFLGLAIIAVLAQVFFADITDGSDALNIAMIVGSYAMFVLGVVTAEVLRRSKRQVFDRIGRQ